MQSEAGFGTAPSSDANFTRIAPPANACRSKRIE